jgi:hypothetical protein
MTKNEKSARIQFFPLRAGEKFKTVEKEKLVRKKKFLNLFFN